MIRLRIAAALLLSLLVAAWSFAQSAQAPSRPASAATRSAADANPPQFRVASVDEAWRARLPRNAAAATQAYLDRLPADVVARSNAYFEGGYWLQLWNFLAGLVAAAAMLHGEHSARVRDWSMRVGRKRFLADAVYGAVYMVASFILTLPLTIYQGFVREHAYGMATQDLAAWGLEQLVGLSVSVVVGAWVVSVLYITLRRAGQRWWLWGALTATVMLALIMLVSPIWIDPLFNTYKPVEDGPIKSSVLAMAQANGVPADNVFEFDASRQTTRISANVTGIFGSAAVRLNDNLLRRSSPPEIRAVMAHELGHYVMNHIPKMLLQMAVYSMAAFLFAQWAMVRLLERKGSAWGLTSVADVAGLPLMVAVISVFIFVTMPVLNTMVRTQEMEADRFGLNLAREPHGAAEAYLQLVEYRKPDPGPIEEGVFFDHPSARTRILQAMRWREAMGSP